MEMMLPSPVLKALDRLEGAGFAAYAVGGCVRDRVLGMTPHDYDICTAAKPEEMQRVFAGERTVETGLQHGTLTVLLSGMPLEITTFRVDGEYLDGRHPSSVRFADRVEEDLSRRDFTINAMAYSPRTGIVDPFGGREDCERGVIRCVGAPQERFGEDALRILRALRFSARLRFPIEESTDRAIRDGKDRLQKISRERIAAELTGLLQGGNAHGILKAYPDVLAAVAPQLLPLTAGASWPRTLDTLAAAPRDCVLRWAALLLYCGGTAEESAALAQSILQSLKMAVKFMDGVCRLVAWQDAPLRPGTMQEMLMRLGPDSLKQLILLRQACRLAAEPEMEGAIEQDTQCLLDKVDQLLSQGACYTLGQLAVNGRDMAAAGLRGPAIGQALNGLLLKVVRGEAPNQRQALLALLDR